MDTKMMMVDMDSVKGSYITIPAFCQKHCAVLYEWAIYRINNVEVANRHINKINGLFFNDQAAIPDER
jgi:hypothetical protein